MKISHTWLLLFITLLASAVAAQERGGRRPGGTLPETVLDEVLQTYKQLDEKPLQEVHERDFKIKTEVEPVKTKLFRADPKLLENKFVATFVVMPAGLNVHDPKSLQEVAVRQLSDGQLDDRYPNELRSLIVWNQRYLFRPGTILYSDTREALSGYFKNLSDNCPPVSRPPQRLIDFLTSAECNRDVQRRNHTLYRGNERGESVATEAPAWRYTIHAPTAEEAQARAAAILQLIDCGLMLPMQRFALEQGKAELEAARQAETEIAAANKAIAVEQEKLEKPSEISADILSQLKAQKIMVAIELSGLSARVKACDAMLTKELPASTLASIGDMKVKAEIDRVGIKEKLDRINALIAEGDTREGAKSRLTTLNSAKRRAQSQLSIGESTSAMYALVFELYAPLQLEDNQITISPIEWTN